MAKQEGFPHHLFHERGEGDGDRGCEFLDDLPPGEVDFIDPDGTIVGSEATFPEPSSDVPDPDADTD